ncbi:putative nuclease: PROVISIONAL [Gigaspora margarita]|uniref:Putative nuclease: PROVISIONAL n=1 Tax=Gigaspora margarita TaxID=4874 RepID=A0A8H3X2Y1_GIGMA|nr:putative nuclease: PROVISIONAL [Gigaspora margarita]
MARGVHIENLCHEIITKYLGSPQSKIADLKTSKYPSGLKLDIYYSQYGLVIEVQGYQHEKYIEFLNSFIEGIPIILSNSKSRINSRKNCAKKAALYSYLRELGMIIFSNTSEHKSKQSKH